MATHEYDIGNPQFVWTAHNYHPHQRGLVWYFAFCGLMVGAALLLFTMDSSGWVPAFSILILMALYCFLHKDGDQDHEVHFMTKGLVIDANRFIAWDEIDGYWFNYDPSVAVINFEISKKMRTETITLQMGDNEPDDFRNQLASTPISEIKGRHESLLDLWIRVMKL